MVRVAGWICLIAGALLCVTLVWATLGFLLMGVGLLSLLVAENNRKRAARPETYGARVDRPVAAPPVEAPPPVPEPTPLIRREPPMGISAPAEAAPAYDRLEWQRLLESDADLAGVASVLADYGQQYVDELAGEYLAAGDKTRLAGIVDGIIARAGASPAPLGNASPAKEARPASPVRRTNLLDPRFDRQPRPLPPAKSNDSETLPASAPQPAEPVEQETVSASIPPPSAMEPEPVAEDRNKTILSADEELTAMLGKLSPDAAAPGKNR